MKKFNLEKAKLGAEIVTKSGKDVKILYYERKSQFSIVAIIEDMKVNFYTTDGKYYSDKDSDIDLKIK
jgi:hypothetical protein